MQIKNNWHLRTLFLAGFFYFTLVEVSFVFQCRPSGVLIVCGCSFSDAFDLQASSLLGGEDQHRQTIYLFVIAYEIQLIANSDKMFKRHNVSFFYIFLPLNYDFCDRKILYSFGYQNE